MTGPNENITAMTGDPRIKYIEESIAVALPAQTSATQWTTFTTDPRDPQYQWHLDRLDELSWANRDSQHNLCTEGREAYAYVLEPYGVYPHVQFENRLISLDFAHGANGSADTTNGCTTLRCDPTSPTYAACIAEIGHGTWVASVLAGVNIGAAKTNVVSMRLTACDGTLYADDLIDAVEWIADPLQNPYIDEPGVINHSGFIPTWDANFQAYSDAVEGAVTGSDIPFFTSADNYSTDACNFSPNDRAYTRVNQTGTVFVTGGTEVNSDGTDPNDYRWQVWNSDGGCPEFS